MAKLIEKNVFTSVREAVASSTNNVKLLKTATVNAILFAAQVGRVDALNELFSGVASNDAEGIRLYVVNMTRAYGAAITADNGNERKISFLAFNGRDNKWSINNKGNPETVEAAAATRAAVVKADISGLMDIVFGKVRNEVNNATAREFGIEDFEKAIANVLVKAAKNGIPASRIMQYNRLLDKDFKVNVTKVADTAIQRAKTMRANADRVLSNLEKTSKDDDTAVDTESNESIAA